MFKERKQYFLAVAAMMGTMLGVGLFGIPYALSKAGAAMGLLYFFVLGGIQLLQHLYYAETAMATKEKLRLVGLTGRHLGRRARHVAAAANIFGFWGGQVAYILVGGTFLWVLFAPLFGGNEFTYQLVWAAVGASALSLGLGLVSSLNAVATVALIGALLLIFGFELPNVRTANFDWFTAKDLFLPYGIILFALTGLPAIPEMEDILGGKHRRFRNAVAVGTLAATILTAGFGYVIYGVTGAATTPDAVSGLKTVIGNGTAALTAVFGFLAVVTSFLMIGINLRETFEYDYRMKKFSAWLLAAGVPIAVVLLGAKNFVNVIGFTGAVFGGVTAILVVLLYMAVTKKRLLGEKALRAPMALAYLSIVVLALGAGWEIVTTLTELL